MNEIADKLLKDAQTLMDKQVHAFVMAVSSIRTARANASVLNKLHIVYYGIPTKVVDICQITVLNGVQLKIKPYDSEGIKQVELAIMKSDIGIAPMFDGETITLNFPPVTQERKQEMVKKVDKEGESFKITLRGIRRDYMELIKKMKMPQNEEIGYIVDMEDITKRSINKLIEEINIKKDDILK